MNHYTIDILKSDILYVIEAIRMRGYAIADQVASQVTNQEQARIKAEAPQTNWSITTTDTGDMVAVNAPAKKRGRPSKKAAPFGLKKDGTPKAKPGRKTAS